jgi:WXG100 family type VII secretion target
MTKEGGAIMDLKINYTETINTGRSVQAQNDSFVNLLGKIEAVNAELQTYWQGSDASKYTGAVAEQAQYMRKLSNTIQEIGAFLIKSGEAYRKVSEDNASGITSGGSTY